MEIWKEINGFYGKYSISNKGRLKNNNKNAIIKRHQKSIQVYLNNKKYTLSYNKILWDHFNFNEISPIILLENEKWVKIYNFPYYVSNFGRIFSCIRNSIVNPSINKKGYYYLNLSNGKVKTFYLHRIVANAFIDNPNNNMIINHIDNNPLNCFVNNLEWCTTRENTLHSVKQDRHARGERNGHHKLTDSQIIELIKDAKNGIQMKFISLKYKISESHICSILKGRYWKHLKIDKFKIKKHYAHGEKSPKSKLTQSDIDNIRLKYLNKDSNQYELAKIYKVSQYNIWAIVNYKTWKT